MCASRSRWRSLPPWAACAGRCSNGSDLSLAKQLALYCGGLFVCCMVCHGELYRLKPDPRHLTGFYLMIAAGGALGGLFVAVAAPLLFTDYYELHWGLFLCGLLFLLVCATDRTHRAPTLNPPGAGWPARSRCWSSADWTGCWRGCPGRPKPSPRALHRLAHRDVDDRWRCWWSSWIARRKFRNFRYWRFLACVWLFLGLLALGRDPLDAGARVRPRSGLPFAQFLRRADGV